MKVQQPRPVSAPDRKQVRRVAQEVVEKDVFLRATSQIGGNLDRHTANTAAVTTVMLGLGAGALLSLAPLPLWTVALPPLAAVPIALGARHLLATRGERATLKIAEKAVDGFTKDMTQLRAVIDRQHERYLQAAATRVERLEELVDLAAVGGELEQSVRQQIAHFQQQPSAPQMGMLEAHAQVLREQLPRKAPPELDRARRHFDASLLPMQRAAAAHDHLALAHNLSCSMLTQKTIAEVMGYREIEFLGERGVGSDPVAEQLLRALHPGRKGEVDLEFQEDALVIDGIEIPIY